MSKKNRMDRDGLEKQHEETEQLSIKKLQEGTDQLSMKKLRKAIRKAQNAKRYEHTLGVEYTAGALAMRYGANVNDALLAGLLHDCAKCLSDKKLLEICENNNLTITETERQLPFLLHGKAGAILAEKSYGVRNREVLDAIVNHTTGREGMSLLEKIVFVADYIEPGRSHSPNLEELRILAFQDLDSALLRILEGTLTHLKSQGYAIDPRTENTWNYYMQRACQES